MKKLPELYKNNINKKINNNKKICYLNKKTEEIKDTTDNKNISETLDEIFNGIGYSYNIQVIIETNDSKYETSLIARTKNNIITIDNEVIPINKINNLKII